jgi:two-component system sensor histidine kinase CpxA
VEQRSTPEQAGYLKKLDAELQHMARLVEEVLAFSKAETLPERETAEDIHLHEMIVAVIAREAPDADIQLNVSTNLHLHSLRDALDRAVGNILRNAARYAADSGPIQIHANQQDDQTIIRISDQGPGVPPDTLPRLFEPFYRPEAARRRSTGGSGLGLAITKRCIEACRGTVTARLREPTGLEIEISIPTK